MTMRDVAQLAGVSSAAVSRYLNGGYLSEEKRERIRLAIEQTGYAPSAQARSLRTGSSRIVGVIVPKVNSESIGRITAGIGQVLREQGYQMLLADTANHPDRELEYLQTFERHPVEGIVLVGTVATGKHLRAIRTCMVPVIVAGQMMHGANCIYHDDYGAARDLAAHIASRPDVGRIGYIGVTRTDAAVGAARLKGFTAGLKAQGRALEGGLYREASFNVESGFACAQELLERFNDIDFISCATDIIAAGAIRAFDERFGAGTGANHVSGFGDNQLLQAVTGGIPTVHFAYKTSGIKATQMLLGLIAKESEVAMQMKLGYTLVGV
ncbi:transcriptional regulator, LacI family [Coriobacterium glomerans PW2]|uniref:Transcriptional regulator, LacI family n=1 Tax=Coriobacterium glomerans (strain ATCC 49209 / DSM 20642 / JCM 10262 / PW2) TaxID=700015 RepID=F2NA74_CORGP|nr:LacI family DNA-binding transcriptional regulator [Coriobacterium glomerans]AEB06468.1 transcriptional regulator, LacI family [Coriobacterium glomerans PW2]